MTVLEVFLKREQVVKQKLEEALSELKELGQNIANESCPYKVGDIVNDGVYNYQVAFIDAYEGWRKSRYTLRGRQMKKDGTPGKIVRAIWREVTLIKKAGE